MTEEELQELMSEPPFGANHGFSRNAFGSWSSLEDEETVGPRRQVFSQSNQIHGFAYGYQDLKCRCVMCRAWKAATRGRTNDEG